MNRVGRMFCGQLVGFMAVTLAFGGTAQEPDAVRAEPDATTTLHHIKTVFLIVMENHNWTGASSGNIKGNSAAPYINYTLLPMASYANGYKNPPGIHPSLPNYLWLEGGTSFGVRDDGLPSQHNLTTSNHLVKLLEKAGMRTQYTHAVDIAPTIYELLGVELPEVVNGYTQHPLEGESFASSLRDADAKGKATQFYSMLGTRGIYHDGWKAASVTPAAPNAWGDFDNQRWELFDVENDPSECHDLADEQPEKLKELVELWWSEAKAYGALPLESRDAIGILLAPRPQLSKPRDRYVYYPDCAEVPESVTPNIRNRSYAVAVEVKIDSAQADGVLFAQGARFGGHALYLKGGIFKYVYNWVGEFEQIVESTKPIPVGEHVLSASFVKEGDGMPTEGTLTLYLDDDPVGEAKIKTQPGKFSLAGEGLNVGKEGGEPVTDDYPGTAPWAFTGGTIHKATIDVAGEPWVDLETELAGAFARD